ncbi:GTP-binding protein [bacterium]|nr:GTP-binding protein [bacterium]
MVQKKVCMLGTFAVGKTSLVSRFVSNVFSDKYLTTLGVKIEKRAVDLDDQSLNLIIWDVSGDDEFERVRPSYLRGASGFVLVIDGTRSQTLVKGLNIIEYSRQLAGEVPVILVINKRDLADQWEIEAEVFQTLTDQGYNVIKTSAKTGEGVDEAFQTLAKKILEV